MTTNDDNTANTDQADCVYCGDKFPSARAEIGYPYCMKPACTAQGKADRKTAPVEIDIIQPEARF